MALSSLPIFFFFVFVFIIIPISHSLPFIVLHVYVFVSDELFGFIVNWSFTFFPLLDFLFLMVQFSCFHEVCSIGVAMKLRVQLEPFLGIGDKCSNKGMRKFTKYLSDNSGSKGYCIEIGNGGWDSWFMTLEAQSQIVCNKVVWISSWFLPQLDSDIYVNLQLVKKMKDLKEGFNFVGLSQGNLIGRAVVEFCDGAPPSGIWCLLADDLLKLAIYSDVVQNSLAPSGFIKLPNDIPNYLEHCKFLPKLNNERPDARNSTYKERFSSLKNLVLIMFEDDTVLVPKETSWFGYYPDGEFEPILPPQQTKLYIEDWIGLRSLDEGGRVKFIKVAGGHLGISYSDAKKYIVPYLEEEHQPSQFDLQIKTNNVSSSLA
uniref:Palmitoyl-protein thioesterase 1-like n=1 Tax=Cucumis melo TaxID=3656 RepID=A0A9I9CLK3_CUCME